MAISRIHTWSAGDILTASDLNTEFNNIINNGADLVSPFTKSISLGGFALYFDLAQTQAFTPSAKGLNISGSTGFNETINTVASSATPDIWTGVGNVVSYSGTVTCTGFIAAPQAGARRVLIPSSNAPFTAGANMLIDGYASGSTYTAVAGDKVHIIAVTTTQFRLTPSYQDSSVDYLLSVSGTNTITATTQHTLPAYKVGQQFTGIAAATNSGATTLAISGLSAGAVQVGGSACVGGELVISRSFRVVVTSTTPTFELASNPVLSTTATELSGTPTFFAPITNSLSGNVALNNTANYFDGPSIAQGSTGKWFVSGTVTLFDTAGGAAFAVKLWDGTTVISSAYHSSGSAVLLISVALSGYISSPAGNLRISAKDLTSTSGLIEASASGNSKDSTITAFRIG
jgi:hypothetical protein